METPSDPYLRHLFDSDSLLNVYKEDVTNLSVGAPGPEHLMLCPEIMEKATKHRLEEEMKEGKYYAFQYGITPGLWECREELAKFLSKRYGDPVRRDNLILTCGATHGLQLLLNTVLSPNGIIFVEEFTYMIALDVFKSFPLMKIVTVPTENDLINLDTLEKIVAEEKKKGNFFLSDEKIYWSMFYTIPTFHNPTGTTLPPERCRDLVELARKYSMAVICDDVYNLLYYGTNDCGPHRLLYYDDPKDPNYAGGNVISNGSFSKILSPAIRVGWIESNPRVVKIMKESGILRSGGAVNHYMSSVIASLLHQGLEDEYLNKLIEEYKDRLLALCQTLDRYLPSCCSYRQPEGGYFVWIHLPECIARVNDAEFVKWCQQEYKVAALPGSRFSNTNNQTHYLRISISFHSKERLVLAAKQLCAALLNYIRK